MRTVVLSKVLAMRFSAKWAAEMCAGSLIGADTDIEGASFDSREIRPREMFIAVNGVRDGHDFVDQARQLGAAACLVSASWAERADRSLAVPMIAVDDTVTALGSIAASARANFEGPVIGITGSVGKTTTKELVRIAVGSSMLVHASEASFNNDLGVPVSILRAPADADVMVLEMGMRGFGEIARLCRIAGPTIGVVTAVASAHSERVGGIEGVAKAKGELIESLSANSLAVLNADDERVLAMKRLAAGSVLTFGTSPVADVYLEAMDIGPTGCVSATVRTPWGAGALSMRVPGVHIAVDAAAAIAVAGSLGCDVSMVAAHLGEFAAVNGRMEVHHLDNGCTLLDDSYNANPSSMIAAIRTLADVSAQNRIAVLGTMAEISDSEREHKAIVAACVELGITVLALEDSPYPCESVDVAKAVAAVRARGAGTAVLVKGSRAAKTERVVQALLARG